MALSRSREIYIRVFGKGMSGNNMAQYQNTKSITIDKLIRSLASAQRRSEESAQKGSALRGQE